MSEPPSRKDLQALNAERLRQWAETLTEADASAIVVLGVGLGDPPGRVEVLSPEGVSVPDILRLLLHAANTVAVQEAIN